MADKIIYLNLDEVELQGWEREKSGLTLAAMDEGLKLGHKFPPVDVTRVGPNKFQLTVGYEKNSSNDSYGGHYRSALHYIEGVPLKCREILQHRADTSEMDFFPIGDIILTGDDIFNQMQTVFALQHLPRKVAKRFCKKNKLKKREYLHR